MAVKEIYTDDLVLYTVEKRNIKDEYTEYKALKDRHKIKNWLNALLQENEVIIFYFDEDEQIEKNIIATSKGLLPEDYNIPTVKEEAFGEEYDTTHHIGFLTMPDRVPHYLHVDDITKFILKNDNVSEISNKTTLY